MWGAGGRAGNEMSVASAQLGAGWGGRSSSQVSCQGREPGRKVGGSKAKGMGLTVRWAWPIPWGQSRGRHNAMPNVLPQRRRERGLPEALGMVVQGPRVAPG